MVAIQRFGFWLVKYSAYPKVMATHITVWLCNWCFIDEKQGCNIDLHTLTVFRSM